MKKIFWASVVMMSLVACGENESDTLLTPDEQKVEMETIASDLMTEFAATEFEDVMETVSDLYLSCEETFAGDYDWSALESVYEERYDEAVKFEEIGKYDERYTYSLLFSTISGSITLGENAATYKDAENTTVEYTDDNGIKWTAEITPVGTVKTVYLGESVSTSGGIVSDFDGGSSSVQEYNEYTRVTVSVPEKLVVSLKKNGQDYLTSTTTFDISISKDGVDVEKDKVSVTTTLEAQGVKVVLEKLSLDATSGKHAQSAKLYKDGKFICSVKSSVEGDIDFEEEEWNAKNINVEVDLLGKMLIKGTCPDAKSIENIMENADPQSAKDWDRIVNNINTKYNLNVYFNGGSTPQAIMNLEARWDGDEYAECWTEPAIQFNDGSRYLLYEYFTEDNFSETVEGAESFVEKYERLIDMYFGFWS